MIGEHNQVCTGRYDPRQLWPSDGEAKMSSDAHGERGEAAAEVPDEGMSAGKRASRGRSLRSADTHPLFPLRTIEPSIPLL